ncbi:MAG: hypothetical protein ACTHMJ_22710 [Thermomicrobiales bacterium]
METAARVRAEARLEEQPGRLLDEAQVVRLARVQIPADGAQAILVVAAPQRIEESHSRS